MIKKIAYLSIAIFILMVCFSFSGKAEAYQYSYSCQDGGNMTSDVYLSSYSFPAGSPTSFAAYGRLLSTCETKTVTMSVNHNNTGYSTFPNINSATVGAGSNYPPFSHDQVNFNSLSLGGTYPVAFQTAVYESFQCSDGIDNDGDLGIDYNPGRGGDPDCTSPIDNFEFASGGGGSPLSYYNCFIEDTKILMADGTVKNIEDVKIGDVLKGETTNNIVLAYHRPPGLSGLLYGVNGGRIFFTEEHPFKTTEGWKSVNPEKTNSENIGIEVAKLEVGDTMIREDSTEEVKSIESESAPSDTPLYNFFLSGDHTYYADGYLVHNKENCTLGGTCVDITYDPHILTNLNGGAMPVSCTTGFVYEDHYGDPVQMPGCGNGSYNYLGCYYPGYKACGTAYPN